MLAATGPRDKGLASCSLVLSTCMHGQNLHLLLYVGVAYLYAWTGSAPADIRWCCLPACMDRIYTCCYTLVLPTYMHGQGLHLLIYVGVAYLYAWTGSTCMHGQGLHLLIYVGVAYLSAWAEFKPAASQTRVLVCLTSQQNVFQGRICSDNLARCHTEREAAAQTCYLIQYTDIGPASPSEDPEMPVLWHDRY